jgi:acyl dehydratase
MNLQKIRDYRFPTQRLAFTNKDTCLYALGVGVGSDPLEALPTMAAVLATPGAWITRPEFEVNYSKLLHGEQSLTVHKSLPASGEVEANYRVPAVVDKGEGKGALVYFEKNLSDAASGEALCTVSSTLFCRADGGCGSFGTPPAASPAGAPGSKPEFTDELKTALGAALLYRLNGDYNPLHIDPATATKAGFDRPILHGLCTYGIAGYLLVRTVCGHDTKRLRSFNARFSSPVYPGETIKLEAWRGPEGVHFQALVPERNQVVLNQGFARVQ